MTIEEMRRELFESWAITRRHPVNGLPFFVMKNGNGDYLDGTTIYAWEGFNAALDAVVIDIRKDYFPGSDNMGAIVLDKNYSRFAFLRIIEDTGLGLKVKV